MGKTFIEHSKIKAGTHSSNRQERKFLCIAGRSLTIQQSFFFKKGIFPTCLFGCGPSSGFNAPGFKRVFERGGTEMSWPTTSRSSPAPTSRVARGFETCILIITLFLGTLFSVEVLARPCLLRLFATCTKKIAPFRCPEKSFTSPTQDLRRCVPPLYRPRTTLNLPPTVLCEAKTTAMNATAAWREPLWELGQYSSQS